MRRTKVADVTGRLFDYAVASRDGFTRAEACRELRIQPAEFTRAVKWVRKAFEGDSFNLICSPNGRGEQWTYCLSGDVDAGRVWTRNRISDAKGRFQTMESMTQSLVNATDGRTVDGRIAREMNMAAKHLLERLALIEETC